MNELRTWIDDRSEGIPPALQSVMHDGIGGIRATGDTAGGLVDGAAVLLTRALSSVPMRREQALDLLAADALATMAFEAAADDPATFAVHARRAMNTIGVMGTAHGEETHD